MDTIKTQGTLTEHQQLLVVQKVKKLLAQHKRLTSYVRSNVTTEEVLKSSMRKALLNFSDFLKEL